MYITTEPWWLSWLERHISLILYPCSRSRVQIPVIPKRFFVSECRDKNIQWSELISRINSITQPRFSAEVENVVRRFKAKITFRRLSLSLQYQRLSLPYCDKEKVFLSLHGIRGCLNHVMSKRKRISSGEEPYSRWM